MKKEQNNEESGQLILPIMHSEVQKITAGGVEMGVLENGMPYLSQRGLVKMAGIPRTSFQELGQKKRNVAQGLGDIAVCTLGAYCFYLTRNSADPTGTGWAFVGLFFTPTNTQKAQNQRRVRQ